MARTPSEVTIGPATLYLDELDGGEAVFPANPETVPAAGWEDPGYTEEGSGWTISIDNTFEDINVEEELDPIAIDQTARLIVLEGVLAQATLENLRIAMGGGTITDDAPAVGFKTFTPPAINAAVEWQALLRAKSPLGAGLFRDWQFPRVKPVGALEIPHRKGNNITTLAVRFRVLVPSGGGDPYTVIDDKTV